MMAEIGSFIKEIGFPIFVAVYVLMRIESSQRSISDNIGKLAKAIAVLSIRLKISPLESNDD